MPEIVFQDQETAVVNIGSPIHAILADMKARFPAVHDEIRVRSAPR